MGADRGLGMAIDFGATDADTGAGAEADGATPVPPALDNAAGVREPEEPKGAGNAGSMYEHLTAAGSRVSDHSLAHAASKASCSTFTSAR